MKRRAGDEFGEGMSPEKDARWSKGGGSQGEEVEPREEIGQLKGKKGVSEEMRLSMRES